LPRVVWIAQIVLALLAVCGPRLMGADWEGLPVKEIRHQAEGSGLPTIPTGALEDLVPQKTGEAYRSELVRQSIERLYATGRFTDIRVDASGDERGVIVTFLTRSAYFVGTIRIPDVAAPPGESQLRAATHLELGRVYSPDVIPAAVDGLRRVLEEEGYFHPQISPIYNMHPDTQQIDITFDVTTGPRARLGMISLTGAPVLPVERLLRAAGWKTGKPFTLALVQSGLEGIRKLYRREHYLGASVEITAKKYQTVENRADLDLAVNAGPQIGITVTGATVNRRDLERLVPVFEVGSVDDELLAEGRRNLADYFQDQGYFDAKVSYQHLQAESAREDIEYQVTKGARRKLEEIRISGNHYFSEPVLRERMKMATASLGLRYGRFNSKLLNQDLAAIRTLYEKNGFLAVATDSKLERTGDGEEPMRVLIEIREGPQTRIGKLSITGNRSFTQAQLERAINGATGQPYSVSLARTDGDSLLTFYLDQGFPHASFRSVENPSPDKARVDLEYVIDEGSREYVRHIFVDGLEHTRRGIVNRELQVRDGAPLSQAGLLDTQRHLYDLGIFNRVTVAVQNPDGLEAERNVLVYLEEARRYTLKMGLGGEVGRFGGSSKDRTNTQGKSAFSPDFSFELTRLNVGGRPHTASLTGRFSTLEKLAGLGYTAPHFLNHPTLDASVKAFFEESRDVLTFTAQRTEGALQFQQKKSKVTTLLYRYAFRRVTVDTSTVQISDPENQAILASPVLVGMLDLSLIRDTRDNPAESHQGMFTSVDIGAAAKQIGSQASFAKFLLQNSSYYRIGKRLVLARSTQFGFESPFGKGRDVVVPPVNGQPSYVVGTKEIPIAEHFFSGGGNSHRGFGVNQAGPRDPVSGFPLGGNALVLNSVELRFPIWGENIGGAVFHDVGNVFTRLSDFSLRQHQRKDSQGNPIDFNYISHAVGFGLRYRTPVGPIRMDFGYDLNPTQYLVPALAKPRKTAGRWQFSFSIGQTF
jgi:outer membrane protein insertion porin family